MITSIKTLDGQEHTVGVARIPLPCFRCGVCCTGFLVKLTTKDIRVLSRGLGLAAREFRHRYVNKTLSGALLQRSGDDCVFLEHEDKGAANCTVHAFRPEVCRNFVPSLSRQECQQGLRVKG